MLVLREEGDNVDLSCYYRTSLYNIAEDGRAIWGTGPAAGRGE